MEKKYDNKFESWTDTIEETFLTCLVAVTVIGSFLSFFFK
jgi:hypothetical protein